MATNSAKERYIARIRSESAYPTFRSIVSLFAVILYVVGTLFIIGGLFGGLVALAQDAGRGIGLMIVGAVVGIIYIILGKVSKEAAFMLADVADSLTDLNSRNEQQP
jgi:hypothetical protein